MDAEERELLHAAELLSRLNREIASLMAHQMALRMDAIILSDGMVRPINGGGAPADPMREDAAQRMRKNFRVVKGKIEQ